MFKVVDVSSKESLRYAKMLGCEVDLLFSLKRSEGVDEFDKIVKQASRSGSITFKNNLRVELLSVDNILLIKALHKDPIIYIKKQDTKYINYEIQRN